MKPIVCRYERISNRIVGHCDELELVTHPWLGRMEAEEELIAKVLKRLGERIDDVIFVHGATQELPDA